MDSESSLAPVSLPAGHVGVSWEEPDLEKGGRRRVLPQGCLRGGSFLLSGMRMESFSAYSVFKDHAFTPGPCNRGPVSHIVCLWAPRPGMQPTLLSLRGVEERIVNVK